VRRPRRHSNSFSTEEVLAVESVLSRLVNSTDPKQRITSPVFVSAYRKFLMMRQQHEVDDARKQEVTA